MDARFYDATAIAQRLRTAPANNWKHRDEPQHHEPPNPRRGSSDDPGTSVLPARMQQAEAMLVRAVEESAALNAEKQQTLQAHAQTQGEPLVVVGEVWRLAVRAMEQPPPGAALPMP